MQSIPDSSTTTNKWLPDVIRAFQSAGNEARFPQIYRWIQSTRQNLPDEWESAVRACVYAHSSDSPVYKAGDPDVFYKKCHGLWALRFPDVIIDGKTEDFIGHVFSKLSDEQHEKYNGNREALFGYVREQITEYKRRYGMLD